MTSSSRKNHPRAGFTLAELLIVIVIMAILSLMITNFNFNRKTDTERSTRMTNYIVSTLNTARLQSITWKGIKNGAVIINPSDIVVSVSTGSIAVKYFSGQIIIGTGESITTPLFGDKGYTINNLYTVDKWLTGSQSLNSAVDIVFHDDGTIAFSGTDSNASSGAILGITAGFHAINKSVELDRRSGKISVQ